MERFCLDTDFLVDFLRGRPYAANFVREKEESSLLATTFINLFELYLGAFKSDFPRENAKAVGAIPLRFTVFNFSQSSVKLAGKLLAKMEKEGKPVGTKDLFIGAIAATNNLAMKTNNVKDFSRIEGVKLA